MSQSRESRQHWDSRASLCGKTCETLKDRDHNGMLEDLWLLDQEQVLTVTRDLFIQGLSSFQKMPEEDQLSYFGISGKLPLPNPLAKQS